MVITAAERMPKRRGRVQVFVDGVATFDVTRVTAEKRDLRPGRAIDRDEIDAIVAADARKQALDAAAGLLARRPRSERELRTRLAQRRFAPELIDETVARLRALKLIDDAEFARTWTETRDRTSPRGQRLIVQELRGYGVAAPVARDAASAVSDADAAYRVATKRLRSLAALDYAAFRTRLGGFLQRRGFGWEVARATVERCWQERGEGDRGDATEHDPEDGMG